MFKFLHKHKWETVSVNAWQISIEQKCKCGEYRHHLFKHYKGFDEPDWQSGKHPGESKPAN